MMEEWQIKIATGMCNVFDTTGKYQMLQEVGHGSFGRVYKAVTRSGCKTVAYKVIEKRGRSSKELKSLRQEHEIQSQLFHPNILQMLDSFETKNKIVVVTQYVSQSLCRLLDETGGYLPENTVQKLTCNLVSGLHYLHSKRILHRDLKPQNVLIKHNGEAVLCDFGFARSMSTKTQVLTSIKGTPLYMAPELIEEHPYDHNADLWSLGCIVYQMIQGHPPFRTDSILHLIELIRFESISWPDSYIMSQNCKSFLQGLLQKNPSQRLTWPALIEHPFLEKSLLNINRAMPTPFATPVLTSQAKQKHTQLHDIDTNLTDSQAKFLRDTVPMVYGRALDTMADRKRVPPLTSIPESKSLSCKHDGPFKASLAHNVFADCTKLCHCVEQRQMQNRETEEAINNNGFVDPEDDTSSLEELGVSPETEAFYCHRHESYPGKDNSAVDDDLHNNRLPDWNPKADESPIETEEWVVFLQKSMEEIMNGELDSLLQENCTSVLISPLKNLTVNCRVVKYIACLLSLPFALGLQRPILFKIQRVYLDVKVVPNLVYALKVLMSERPESHEKFDPSNAKTRLASKLTSDELQTLEYSVLLLCNLIHARHKFITQFCTAISTVNGFAFLQQLLLLKKKKPRLVADLIAIFNHVLRCNPKKDPLVKQVMSFPSMSWHAHKQFIQLVTHSEEVIRKRTCDLIKLLGCRWHRHMVNIWTYALRNALEKLMVSDPDQTVRLAAKHAVIEIKKLSDEK
ncbi:serine/threonine-protein kinase fused-like [Hylaeus anthracinus]|uniref:serine/threonine-protein kinase fused-like n=1 Tax=Hylaeus anthracinus TaxID=313031 RepID=UPI0023B8D3A2|nr:serine/threonine-protein kinase fused-like [Hylaeus anthracinus]XP_054009360.1 serine/threonine-protein kinase fused-like [Hylaeus anthracinus]